MPNVLGAYSASTIERPFELSDSWRTIRAERRNNVAGTHTGSHARGQQLDARPRTLTPPTLHQERTGASAAANTASLALGNDGAGSIHKLRSLFAAYGGGLLREALTRKRVLR